MIRKLLVAISFLGLLGAILVFKTRPATVLAGPASSAGPAANYTAQCSKNAATANCAILRAAVTANVIDALETLRDARDDRAVDIALDAIGVDQPAVQVIALQILDRAGPRADVMAAVWPVFLGTHPALQQAAAEVLSHSEDSNVVVIADQWTRGHKGFVPDSPYDDDADRAMPAVLAKFPAYPNSTRYTPADSAGSIGWRTPDGVDKVVELYKRSSKGATLDARGWTDAVSSSSNIGTLDDSERQKAIKLSEEYARTQDPKVLAKIQAMQQRLEEQIKQQAAGILTSIYVAPVPNGDSGGTFRVVVLETNSKQIVRAVAIYRQDAIKATVIQMMWDRGKYPGW